MNYFSAIFLGLLQGVTEFLPISSSGHLVIAELLLGIEEASLAFDVALHLGTLLGVFVYFRRDLFMIFTALLNPQELGEKAGPQRLLAFYICLGTIPAVLAGYLLKDAVETVFRSPSYIAASLAGAGLLLLWADKAGKHARAMKSLGWGDAALIGLFQAFALMPGVSRSGITMTAGLIRGFNRMSAARFSFLLSIPVIFGAGIYNLPDIVRQGSEPGLFGFYLTGFIAAAVSGYLVIAFLLRFIQTHSFAIFAYYRFLLAGLVFLTQVL
ncbi:MAG: undecaprenyl-diphosphatase UppP [Deltaproteobacteria bacterium]|jgi:undecaprenyl-diphosphatase|nr:undecaprenyl-diphosphatase UppP [Deltaproteobacteria bacterium]